MFYILQRMPLPSVVDCKGLYEKDCARDACEFNLTAQELRKSFIGFLDVKLYAAHTTEGCKKDLIESEIKSVGLKMEYEKVS